MFCDPFLNSVVPYHLLFSVLFSPLGDLANFPQLFLNEFHVAKFMHDFEFGSGTRAYC